MRSGPRSHGGLGLDHALLLVAASFALVGVLGLAVRGEKKRGKRTGEREEKRREPSVAAAASASAFAAVAFAPQQKAARWQELQGQRQC